MSEQPEKIELVLEEAQIREVNVLIAAVIVGQKAGAYSLTDAKSIQEAVSVLVPEQVNSEEDTSSEEEVA